MTAIGGYFELELPNSKDDEFHGNSIKLNSGRNAFEYLLRANNYRKVYLPYYTCDVMQEPLQKLNIEANFYNIDKTFRPVFDFSRVKSSEVFVYTNYFGVCDVQVEEVFSNCKSLIVDNSQAFFSPPLPNVDTFYSPRKFFGVADGGYLYSKTTLLMDFKKDISFNRMKHLLGRIDMGAESFYESFKEQNELIKNQPIKIMSNLSQRILKSVNYEEVRHIRKNNFTFLHNKLKEKNKLAITKNFDGAPLAYPLFTEDFVKIRTKLQAEKIFVPTYWPCVLDKHQNNSIEQAFVNGIIPLPIDQRYSKKEMDKIADIIL